MKKIKILLPKNKFRMAAKFKMATKTYFACKNYKSSFSKNNFRAVLVALIPKIYRKKQFSKIQCST
jgi:hypothetical protein